MGRAHPPGRPFESTPRLALLSPEKQCGKTRVLELLELLCAGAETLSDASPAYLYRRIGAGQVTILLDEADAIWKRGKSDETAEALRSIVNAGHRRAATVGRVEMNGQAAKLTRFPVYAPAAIAGIGNLPDTIMDRAVVVRMRRRAPGERVRDYRERITRPEGDALREQLAAWAADVAEPVGDPWPDMPPGVADRPADVWEPLLMVADLAGGDWPKLRPRSVHGVRHRRAGRHRRASARGCSPTCGTCSATLTRCPPRRSSTGCTRSTRRPGPTGTASRSTRGTWRSCSSRTRSSRARSGSARTAAGYRRADLEDAWRSYLRPGKRNSRNKRNTPGQQRFGLFRTFRHPGRTAPGAANRSTRRSSRLDSPHGEDAQ